MKYSLSVFLCVIMLCFGCKKEETIINVIPCMEEQQEPIYKVKILNNEFNPISYAFLSSEEGELIRVKAIDTGVNYIEDYCGDFSNYHLTTVTKEYIEDIEKTIYHFLTYLNIPNNTVINLNPSLKGSIPQNLSAHIRIDNVTSVQRVDFSEKYLVNQFFELDSFQFLSENIQMPKYQQYYTKVWANNEQPRFCFYQSSEEGNNGFNEYDYNDLVLTQDTVNIELSENLKWHYSIEGVKKRDPLELVEIDDNFFFPLEIDEFESISTYLPSSEFNLEGFFFYLSGSPQPYHIQFYKYFEEIPNQIIPKEFSIVPISNTIQEIKMDSIPDADILSLGWLRYLGEDANANWTVSGDISDFSFVKPLIPEEIINEYGTHLANIEWELSGGFVLYYYENIHSYEEYLRDFFKENKNYFIKFLSSTESYIGHL